MFVISFGWLCLVSACLWYLWLVLVVVAGCELLLDGFGWL